MSQYHVSPIERILQISGAQSDTHVLHEVAEFRRLENLVFENRMVFVLFLSRQEKVRTQLKELKVFLPVSWSTPHPAELSHVDLSSSWGNLDQKARFPIDAELLQSVACFLQSKGKFVSIRSRKVLWIPSEGKNVPFDVETPREPELLPMAESWGMLLPRRFDSIHLRGFKWWCQKSTSHCFLPSLWMADIDAPACSASRAPTLRFKCVTADMWMPSA